MSGQLGPVTSSALCVPAKNTYLAARYRRLAACRGKKRALVGLRHSILISIWHMFTHDAEYADLGGQYFIERTGRSWHTRRLVGQLNQLGYQGPAR